MCSGVIEGAQPLAKGAFCEVISVRFVVADAEWPVPLFDKTLNTHSWRDHSTVLKQAFLKPSVQIKSKWIFFIIWYFLSLIGAEEIRRFSNPFSSVLDQLMASHSQNLGMAVHLCKLEICTSHYEYNWLIILLIKSDEHWVAILMWLLNATLGTNSPASLRQPAVLVWPGN